MPNRRRAALRIRRAVRALTTPSDRWRRIGQRYGIGHRAAFLLAFGLIFFAVGVGIALVRAPMDPNLFHTRIPVEFRVALWCGTAGTAMALARHPRHQWLAFVALMLAPGERVFSYAFGLVFFAIPGGPPATAGVYLTMGALFGAVLFVTRLIASWPDPPGDVRP